MSAALKTLGALVVVGGAFLAGWYPQHQETSRLAQALAQAQDTSASQQMKLKEAGVKDLGAMLYLEVSRQNYAEASSIATRFFDGVRDLSTQTQDTAMQARLNDILAKRDMITAGLARATPSVAADLQAIMLQLYGISEKQ
jgi:hypothetical protein